MPAEPPDTCAHCGADIHPNARACPECGADESTGWEEDYAPDLGLDEDEFDYDEFVEREFGTGNTPKSRPTRAALVLVAGRSGPDRRPALMWV